MGFRFQRRIPLSKLARLNVSKTGISISLGKKGASINIGKDGITGNAGIPGTGLSYREKLTGKSGNALSKALLILLIIAFLGFVFGGENLKALLAGIL